MKKFKIISVVLLIVVLIVMAFVMGHNDSATPTEENQTETIP